MTNSNDMDNSLKVKKDKYFQSEDGTSELITKASNDNYLTSHPLGELWKPKDKDLLNSLTSPFPDAAYWEIGRNLTKETQVYEKFLSPTGNKSIVDKTYLKEVDDVVYLVAESKSRNRAYSLIEDKANSMRELIKEDEGYEEQEWS